MKIEHRPQCHILAAPDGEYASAIDCDCGATYYALTSRIAKLEAALRLVDDDVRHHIRSDEIGPALIRPKAVKAVRELLK